MHYPALSKIVDSRGRPLSLGGAEERTASQAAMTRWVEAMEMSPEMEAVAV